jgi:hypothetical protein
MQLQAKRVCLLYDVQPICGARKCFNDQSSYRNGKYSTIVMMMCWDPHVPLTLMCKSWVLSYPPIAKDLLYFLCQKLLMSRVLIRLPTSSWPNESLGITKRPFVPWYSSATGPVRFGRSLVDLLLCKCCYRNCRALGLKGGQLPMVGCSFPLR